MDAVRRLASLAHGARQDRKLPVRQPLARMQVAVSAAVRGAALDELLELLRLEVNVKAVEVVGSDAELVRLRAKPNFRSLGKRYGKRTPAIAEAASRLTTEQLRGLEAGRPAPLEVDGETVSYLPEDVVVEREVASDWIVASDGPFVVALDPASRRPSAWRAWPVSWSTGSNGSARKRATSTPTGLRSGSRATRRCWKRRERTRTSSAERRWPAGSSWASGRRRRTWSSR